MRKYASVSWTLNCADTIFERIFDSYINEFCFKGSIDNVSAMMQIMVWHPKWNKDYSDIFQRCMDQCAESSNEFMPLSVILISVKKCDENMYKLCQFHSTKYIPKYHAKNVSRFRALMCYCYREFIRMAYILHHYEASGWKLQLCVFTFATW